MAEDRRAARWFAVRAEFQRLGPLGRAGLWLRELVKLFLSLGLTAGGGSARRFCDVIVVARADGRPVVVFQYGLLADAAVHAQDLVNRLDTLCVDDFCEALDIDPGLVTGAGVEPNGVSEVEWVPIRRDERARYWPTGVAVVPE